MLFNSLAVVVLSQLGLEQKYGRWEWVAAICGQLISYWYLWKVTPQHQLVAIEGR